MWNKTTSPLDVLCRELHRLESDPDRLQMLVTLRSHLTHLQFTSSHFQLVLSNFQTDEYRLQALQQTLPYMHQFITPDSVTGLVELFTRREYRLNVIDQLKNFESLQTNHGLNDRLHHEYRQGAHSIVAKAEEGIQLSDQQPDMEPAIIPCSTSNVAKVLPSTSGVFEKAKQFVCRVFGGGSSSSSSALEESSNKRPMMDELSGRKRLHVAQDELGPLLDIDDSLQQQFQPTSCSVSVSQSCVSLVTKSPPPSPTSPHTTMHHTENILAELNTTLRKQLSDNDLEQPVESNMVIQIHSILDNIDSVLDKIEAHASSASRRPAFNENYSTVEPSPSDVDVDDESARIFGQHGMNQVTQTAIGLIERHLIGNDGSGDTPPPPALIDLLDIVEESSSIFSSDESEDSTE